jgi:hypothetical protein
MGRSTRLRTDFATQADTTVHETGFAQAQAKCRLKIGSRHKRATLESRSPARPPQLMRPDREFSLRDEESEDQGTDQLCPAHHKHRYRVSARDRIATQQR